MRRVFGDAMISLGALAVLLLALVALDDRVRDQLSLRMHGHAASGDLVDAGVHVRDFAAVLLDVVRDQSLDHAPLLIFALAATVLVLFMLRTT